MSEHKAKEATLKVYRGDGKEGKFETYKVPMEAGMVVLDAIHYIQANYAPELAVRWNCKAAKCGSCSAEVNGHPSLMCKTRMDHFEDGEEIVREDLLADTINWMVAAKKSHPSLLLPAWVAQWQENRPTKRAADALRCEEEGCNEPAVMFYCEGHAP